MDYIDLDLVKEFDKENEARRLEIESKRTHIAYILGILFVRDSDTGLAWLQEWLLRAKAVICVLLKRVEGPPDTLIGDAMPLYTIDTGASVGFHGDPPDVYWIDLYVPKGWRRWYVFEDVKV